MKNTNKSQVKTLGDLNYIMHDRYIEICGTSNSSCTEIVIPDEIEGLPVKIIGESAFKKCIYLTSVHIPESITEICDMAFMECDELSGVRLPKALKTLGAGVFAGCSNIIVIHGKAVHKDDAPVDIEEYERGKLEAMDDMLRSLAIPLPGHEEELKSWKPASSGEHKITEADENLLYFLGYRPHKAFDSENLQKLIDEP